MPRTSTTRSPIASTCASASPRARRDNVLARGQVLEGERGHALQTFNEHVQADPRVDNVLLTVGDGLMLAWRTA